MSRCADMGQEQEQQRVQGLCHGGISSSDGGGNMHMRHGEKQSDAREHEHERAHEQGHAG